MRFTSIRGLKKNTKWLITVLLVVLISPSAKNLYLYFYYQHVPGELTKIKGNSNDLTGLWHRTLDTYECGLEERHVFDYEFFPDSSGVLQYTFIANKLNGHNVEVYSWSSLLPFKEKESSSYIIPFRVGTKYLTLLPGENPLFRQPSYTRYKFENGTLFIDTIIDTCQYSEKPFWENKRNMNPVSISEILQFWLPWKQLLISWLA